LNTAKTGITSGQTTAITANSIKYTQAEVDTALALKAPIDDPTFTTKIATPLLHTGEIMSQNSHLKIGSKTTNDLNIFLNDQESLQLTRSGAEIRYQSQGGTGAHRFMNNVYCNGSFNIASGQKYKINNINLNKGDVGLGNVDNTSDPNKPVSVATTTALALKANLAGGPVFSAGVVLTKTVHGSALEWSSHQQLIEVTIDDVRSGSIPIFSSFNMSGVQRFFLELTSNQITSQSVVVVHTWSPDGYENWLPQVSNLRTRYNSGGNTFRATFAVSGTHSMSGNSTTNLNVNYVIM